MAEALKQPHTQIEIINSQNPRSSFGFPGNIGREKIPFFRSRSRRLRRDTWLISLFVLLQVAVFVATMTVNDCATNSHGDCAVGGLGRLAFQPVSENPLLGPAASTLEEMGALQKNLLIDNRNTWRLFTSPWLHAGVLHLLVNLGSLIIVGIYMEQEFGPLRVGAIYALSAFSGSVFSALFIRNSPAVCSSGALFGLMGAMLAALIRDWDLYSHKFAALMLVLAISIVNLILGLLPYVDNFSNIGGLVAGLLLGFVLLFTPQIEQVPQHKASFFEYTVGVRSSMKLKEKLDKPVLRSVSLILFSVLLAVCLIAAFQGVNLNRYCNWCRYADCIPLRRWSCNDMTSSCEMMVSDAELTLTCMSNGNFRIFSYTNISRARTEDLCTLICS